MYGFTAFPRRVAASVQGTSVWEDYMPGMLGYVHVSIGDQDVAGQTMWLTGRRVGG